MARLDELKEEAKRLVDQVIDEVVEGDSQGIELNIVVTFKPGSPSVVVKSTKSVNRTLYAKD